MYFEEMLSEFERSLDDCERTLQVTQGELSLISRVDSSYLGNIYGDRIDELRRKLATMGSEKEELRQAFREIGHIRSGLSRDGRGHEDDGDGRAHG